MNNITKSFLLFIFSYIPILIPYYLSLNIQGDYFSYITYGLWLLLSGISAYFAYKTFKKDEHRVGGVLLFMVDLLPFILTLYLWYLNENLYG